MKQRLHHSVILYFEVDKDNCAATNDDDSAIRLESSNGNIFTNVLHTHSPGAISFLFPDECDNNTILGLSIEQEESHCIVNGRDPGIYIHSDLCNGNVITTNYNFAKTVFASTVVQDAFCQNNTLKDWDNDCNGAITTDCPSNE